MRFEGENIASPKPVAPPTHVYLERTNAYDQVLHGAWRMCTESHHEKTNARSNLSTPRSAFFRALRPNLAITIASLGLLVLIPLASLVLKTATSPGRTFGAPSPDQEHEPAFVTLLRMNGTRSPINAYVASFIGGANVLQGRVQARMAEAGAFSVAAPRLSWPWYLFARQRSVTKR
jgi:hypothetical protein